MSDRYIGPGRIGGSIGIPASKSLCHRAILMAALAQGQSCICNVYFSKDVEATLGVARKLGADVQICQDRILIDGCGLRAGENPTASGREPIEIDCAESGSTLRFVVPILSVAGIPAVFTGRGKLPERPMDVYYHLFDQRGLAYQTKDGKLPLCVTGRLSGGQITIDGGVSSQFVTGLLMALPLAKEDSVLTISGTFASRPYVDLTLGMSSRFGIRIEEKDDHTFLIKGKQSYQACNVQVEADASQAAFLIAAGLIAADEQGLLIQGLDPKTRQGDIAFLEFARQMGARYQWETEGLRVFRSDLEGNHVFDCQNCPDIVPILAVLSAYNQGTVTITHAERLRIKESDRLQAVSEEMAKVGADIRQTSDGLIIRGGKPLQGGTVQAWNDHRIAMSMAVAGLGSAKGITILGAECISKSWPTFFEDLSAVIQ